MSTAPAVTAPAAAEMVEYIGYTSAALSKAAAAQEAHESQETKLAALIPGAVKALLDHERITPDQAEKAAEALKDPVKALQLLTKVAAHRNVAERSLGTGVNGDGQTKNANARGPYVGYCGERTSRTRQSDLNLFERLGLQPPTDE